MDMAPGLIGGSQATVMMLSVTPPQPLMATTYTSQEDMMGTLIQKIWQEIQKALPPTFDVQLFKFRLFLSRCKIVISSILIF